MSARDDRNFRGEEAHPESRTSGIENAISASRRFLLSIQHPDGHWCGELEGDTILESEYILTMHFLGRTGEPRVAKAAEYLRRQQLPEGGWSNYQGGPIDVSGSVKAYFVLKLLGDSPDAPHMARAREVIRALGGIDACNSFTRIYLSIFGQYDWEKCPAVPPELILLPGWSPFTIYRMSSWSRAIVVPLSIIWSHKPSCPVPEHARITELFVPGNHTHEPKRTTRERLWRGFFTLVDGMLKSVESSSFRPLRARALRRAEAWILERLEKSDGLGAIFPPIVNTIIAFRCLGYALDDPRLVRQVRELEKLELADDETLRVQPCFSPVWDTALALLSVRESGVPADDPDLLRAARWLVDHEVRADGDWKKRNPDAEAGGWYFEYANEFYPDTDDTAEVLAALAEVRFPDAAEERRRQAAVARGLAWQLSMQNEDGGWGAFDKACDNEILTFIPFADHNAMIDPSCEDITGRTLEAMRRLGIGPQRFAVRKAVDFLRATQFPDGTWYGRWGCNFIYGTWLALRGLLQAGEDLTQPRYRRAADWLVAHQNLDGGWGELPNSYEDPATKGQGPSTPSQTAWALMALFATLPSGGEEAGADGEAGEAGRTSVLRALDYLLKTQQYDGSWIDTHWTGTGFPKVFYLRYHLYATYFPLWALSLYRQEAAGHGAAEDSGVARERLQGVRR